VAPDVTLTRSRTPDSAVPEEVVRLFHRLNNQLGVVLANAELLEHRLADDALRGRAEQVVSGTLDAINTAQQLRKEVLTGNPLKNPAL
jgi:hypothetical protein